MDDTKKFYGFVLFMVFVLLFSFLAMHVPFFASLVCALVLSVLLRACWLVYCVLFKLISRVDFVQFLKKDDLRRREV